MMVFVILKIYFVFTYQALQPLVLLIFLESLIQSILLSVVLWRVARINLSVRMVDSVYGIALLKKSSWLLFSGIASIIYLKIDVLMLEWMMGDVSVGIYSAASRLSEISYFLPTIIASTFFPLLLASKKHSVSKYWEHIGRLMALLFLAGLGVSAAMFLLAPLVISLIYGGEYRAAVVVLQIHIWASIFVYMRAVLSKWILSEDIVYLSLLTQMSGAISNVFLNLILIPKYGVVGAAVGTVFSYAMASYFSLWFVSASRPMARIMTTAMFKPWVFVRRKAANG
jgi:O-antigen/teichoic acid export membrane protein